MSKAQRERFFLRYTIMFSCVAAVILTIFILSDRNFVCGQDGQAQHLAALKYQGEWLRSGLSGEWKMVDLSLGQGMDVLTTLDYYSFTDPVSMIVSFLFCNRGELAYAIVTFARFYLAGLFACMLAREMELPGWSAAVCGLLYAWSPFAFGGGMSHLNFGVGLMYLPLLIWGVERVFHERGWGIYALVVAVQLCANFYFAYMNTVIAIIYIIVRLAQWLMQKKPVAVCAKKGFALMGGYILGTAMAAVIFLPVALAFLDAGRVGEAAAGYDRSLFHYGLKYYRDFFLEMFGAPDSPGVWATTGYIPHVWTSIGFIPLTAFGLSLLMIHRRKETAAVRAMLGITLIMLCIPAVGKVMNGLGYVTNRWSYALSLFIALGTAFGCGAIDSCGKKTAVLLCIGWTAYALACMWIQSGREELFELALFGLSGALLLTAVARKGRNSRWLKPAISVLTTISMMIYAALFFIPQGDGQIAKYHASGKLDNISNNPMSVFEDEKGKGVYRVSGESLSFNDHRAGSFDAYASGIGYYGASYYWSVVPPELSTHYTDIASNAQGCSYLINGFGSDASSGLLASVKYVLMSDDQKAAWPQGYEAVQDVKYGNGRTGTVLENVYALPFGYTFDAYLTEDQYQELSAVEKRDALLRTAVVETDIPQLTKDNGQSSLLRLDVDLGAGTAGDGAIRLDSGLTFGCDVPAEGEVFLVFDGVRTTKSRTTASLTFTVKGGEGLNKSYVSNPASTFSYAQRGAVLAMGVHPAGNAQFVFEGSKNADFVCDKIEAYFRASEDYSRMASALGEDVLENAEIGTNCVNGTISLDECKWLQLSIPYSKGWTATVNGEPAELKRSGGMYMGLLLEAGEHEIELRYCTPYLKVGAVISAGALVIFAALLLIKKVRRAR